MGTGIRHNYELVECAPSKLVVDHTTGLIWERSGSKKELKLTVVHEYVVELCQSNFAGYNDWRLPTLEEAMSLVEPSRKNGDLYLDPIFDKKQTWIWTDDKGEDRDMWVISFYQGTCYEYSPFNSVRAVRDYSLLRM